MPEPTATQTRPDALPEAVIDRHRRISLVWLIPLVAVLTAAWMAYKSYSEQQPLITLTFQTAEGIEAGVTKLKYKNVEVGLVEQVSLSDDLAQVLVKARFARHLQSYLTDRSRFWVVRPRLSGSQVSGLGTVLGGIYIGVDLDDSGKRVDHFTGLETPPVITAGTPGRVFNLQAEGLGSLQIGSPVYFRNIEVGQVVAYHLNSESGLVEIQVFVHAPHHAWVTENTRFWETSGLQFELDASGVRIRTESVASVLAGGIGFGTPPYLAAAPPAASDSQFQLFKDRTAALERRYRDKETWLLYFDSSVRGLTVGAPVEFRGIKIGEVRDIRVELNVGERTARVPVLVEIEPQRVEFVHPPDTSDKTPPTQHQIWDWMVEQGLRAQLQTGSYLTGALFVDLALVPGAAPKQIDWSGKHPSLPTIPTTLDELRGLLSKLGKLPLEGMGDDLRSILAELRQTLTQTSALMRHMNKDIAPGLSETLAQTRQTLRSAENVLTPGTPLHQDIQKTLQELSAAARSIRVMADYLERHPEALIRGKVDSSQ